MLLPIVSLVTAITSVMALPSNEYPVLPKDFNATLLRIGPQTTATPFYWAKLYAHYDGSLKGGGYNKFDFYNHYLNLDNEWSPVCTLLFREGVVYTHFPAENTCTLTHKNLPVLYPWFMSGSVFEGTEHFRGVVSNKWRLGEAGSSDVIYYYDNVDTGSPLRTTNQANDPGATDWFDFTVGKQNATLFELPKVCADGDRPAPVTGCPPVQSEFFLNFQK